MGIRPLIALALLAATAAPARADCPRTPADEVCRPWAAMLLPTAFGVVYAPGDDAGTWLGGGFEVVALAWSDSSPAFGPSHGKLRFDMGVLRSGRDGAGSMVMYRSGAQVSIERNAARRYLIPYLGGDLGGLWTEGTGKRWFMDFGGGVYLLHRRAFIVDLEAVWLIPFSDPGLMGGLRAQLAVSFALW